MMGRFRSEKGLFVVGLLAALLLVLIPAARKAGAGQGFSAPTWTRQLPADTCPGTNHTACHYASPVFADLDNDQSPEIIAATNNGHIVVLRQDGSIMWDRDIAPYFGMSPGTHEIHSSPAVEDLDGDGSLEIIVGAGTLNHSTCTQGGLIVLNSSGKVKSGWPQVSLGSETPPAGCADTIVSSPSVGDLDNDGDMEIVAAGFDKRIYAWHHDGRLMSGFPPNSALLGRFPDWDHLVGQLADNTWSSPVLADLDRDGFLDIIIGTGEGNFDSRWGGDSGGWTCPYSLPAGWAEGYCGGSVYALNRHGQIMPGFPRYFLENISSTPAASDVNDDGKYEIFVGTGNFYYKFSPDHPTDGFRLYGFDSQGVDLPGWAGGKPTGGSVVMSPSIGDITGDQRPEVVVIAADNKVYAWHINGQKVSGFPMTPRDFYGNNSGPFAVIKGQALADTDGDGKMEIIFGQGWSINVVDGDGRQLTGSNYPNNSLPIYNAQGLVLNTPAIDDIDDDGRLELIASSDSISLWDLDNSSPKSHWPMFKTVASRTGVFPQPLVEVSPETIFLLHQIGDPSPARRPVTINNGGSGTFTWSAAAPSGVGMTPNSGEVNEDSPDTITISAPTSGLSPGTYNLGSVSIKATLDVGVIKEELSTHPVKLVVGNFFQVFAPITSNR